MAFNNENNCGSPDCVFGFGCLTQSPGWGTSNGGIPYIPSGVACYGNQYAFTGYLLVR